LLSRNIYTRGIETPAQPPRRKKTRRRKKEEKCKEREDCQHCLKKKRLGRWYSTVEALDQYPSIVHHIPFSPHFPGKRIYLN
jgi:hypothetical protein